MKGFCTSEQFVDYLTSQRHLSMQTVRCYELDLEQFISFLQVAENSEAFSEQTLEAVDADTIKSYIMFLKSKKYSRSSTARKLASLRTYYKFLGKRKCVNSNPAKAVHIPKPKRHHPRLLEDREVRKLLEAPPTDNWLGLRNKALLQTLYSTGVRVGELVALNVDDIDLANGLLYVRVKGKKERIISLERPALRTLADYIRQRNRIIKYNNNGVKALFLNKFGRRLSQRDVRRKMDKYLAAAGLDRSFSPRSLRHSFAARKLHTGCDLSTVKELLGHQALVSTQVYARVS
jgi:integrase/recombinase XerC